MTGVQKSFEMDTRVFLGAKMPPDLCSHLLNSACTPRNRLARVWRESHGALKRIPSVTQLARAELELQPRDGCAPSLSS